MKLSKHGYSLTEGMSPPARGRGLKQLIAIPYLRFAMSPPARGRGLKLLLA